MRQSLALVVTAVAGLLLTACSQIGALTPVGGAAITSVRNATYDVLVDQQVPILVAPQCASIETGFTCTGSTTDGDAIVAEAESQAPYQLRIKVGDQIIFEGTAQQVLEAAALESS